MDQRSPTRQRIITLLKMDAPLTVSELAGRLGITEMAVRRHLNLLERDSLIQSRLERRRMGRPTHHYFLSKQSESLFPKGYEGLTLGLLGDLETLDGTEKVELLFERRKKRLSDQYQARFEGKGFGERVQTLAGLQDELGYMVRMEQLEEESYLLTQHHCPLSEVASRYPQLCDCEQGWFEKMLDAEVGRTECKSSGGWKCSYRIRKRTSGPSR